MKWQSLNKKPLFDQIGEWLRERKAAKAPTAPTAPPTTAPTPKQPPLVRIKEWWQKRKAAKAVATGTGGQPPPPSGTPPTQPPTGGGTPPPQDTEPKLIGPRLTSKEFRRQAIIILAAVNGLIAVIMYLIVHLHTGGWKIVWELDLGLGPNWKLHWGWLLFFLNVLYIAGSFIKLESTEHAAKTVFGKAVQNVGPGGLAIAPRWICNLGIFPHYQFNLLVGTPEEVRARERGETLTSASKQEPITVVRASGEPLRVTFARNEEAIWDHGNEDREKFMYRKGDKLKDEDIFGRRLTTDPFINVLAQVVDPCQYIYVNGGFKEGLAKLERAVMSKLQEMCAKRTAAYFQHYLDEAGVVLQQHLEKFVGDKVLIRTDEQITDGKLLGSEGAKVEIRPDYSWGLDIVAVKIETMGYPKKVNEQMALRTAGGFEKEKTIIAAEASRRKLEEEGFGAAAATQADLLAKSVGREALAEVAKSPEGKFLAALETFVQSFGEGTSKLVVAPPNDLTGIVGSLHQLMKLADETDETQGTISTPTLQQGKRERRNRLKEMEEEMRGRKVTGSDQAEQPKAPGGTPPAGGRTT